MVDDREELLAAISAARMKCVNSPPWGFANFSPTATSMTFSKEISVSSLAVRRS